MQNYPTQKQKNGFKLQLIRDKCEEYQRNAFHKHFPRDPKQLYVQLKKSDNKFRNLLKRKILKQAQYDILLPSSCETHSDKFDCTLLALLLRTECGYMEPPTGWNDEPAAHDGTEIANLIRLKIGRNGIQHNPLAIGTREYQRWYNYLKKPLMDLGCPPTDLNNLLASFQYGLLPVDPLFIGREKELVDIDNKIAQNLHAVVLVGIGGVGKSETTRKYWELYQHKFDGNVIWINANTKLSLEDNFRTVAESLSLETIDPSTGKLKTMKTIVKIVRDYFKDEKVLFIFDNCSAEDKSDIVEFVSKNHSTIITSQVRNWGQRFQEIDIDPFTPADGKLFLKNNLDPRELQDTVSQDRLLFVLDHHPLAVQHAVAYMKETKITTADYLKLLEEHKIQLLSTNVTVNITASASVLGCLDMSLQQIKGKSDDAFKLLNILSFLGGKYIHRELLSVAFKNKFKFLEALRLLQSRSIIKCGTSTVPGKQPVEVVAIHGLYQTAIRADQVKSNVVKESLSSVLDLFFDEYTSQCKLRTQHVNFGEEWYKHLLHILNQESLARYALERIAKNQKLVFETLISKMAFTVMTELWQKLVTFLQCDETDQLLYEARLYAVLSDNYANGLKMTKYLPEVYDIFKGIKENVTDVSSKSLIALISISLQSYKVCNDVLPAHKRKPCVDLGIQPPKYGDYEFFEGLFKEKQYAIALKYLDYSEEAVCNTLGANHVSMQTIHHRRGRCYDELNEFDKAIESLRKAADNRNSALRAARIAYQIACLFNRKRDDKQCLVELKKEEEFLVNIDGQENRDECVLQHDILKAMCLGNEKQYPEFHNCADSVLSKFTFQNVKDMSDIRHIVCICYSWTYSFDKLKELLEHAKNIYSSLGKDQVGKRFLHIMLSDCLIINGQCANLSQVELTNQEAKSFSNILLYRYDLAMFLTERGKYFYALKILQSLKCFQDRGIKIGIQSSVISEKISFCINNIWDILF